MTNVRVVAVSHSAALAEGVVDLACQMAPDVSLVAAGGGDDGGLGTSFDRISAALADLPEGGAVVLYDLGSALLTTETAIEFLDDPAAVTVVDAPLVEGALAAAVEAQGGGDRQAVAAAARSAAGPRQEVETSAADGDAVTERTATLRNPLGLHARPAAELAAALAGFDATVRVGRAGASGVDVRRVLDVVALALRGGDEVAVSASGPDAEAAAGRAAELIASGFDEDPAIGVVGSVPPSATTPVGKTVGGAAGEAVGRLVHAGTVTPEALAATTDVTGGPAGRDRLTAAADRAAAALRQGDAMQRMHAALLDDPALREDALSRAQEQPPAPAWWAAVEDAAQRLAGTGDDVVAARAADVRDAGLTVLRELGVAVDRVPADASGRVLAADELGPGEVATFVERGGAALVLSGGAPTAHATVVARGLGLPLVLRAGDLLAAVPDGTVVAVNGGTGEVVVDPPDAGARADRIAAARRDREAELADAARPVPGVVVAANVASVAEARAAVRQGADAVGLLRTELLVLDRPELPGEDEQVADLVAVLDELGERRVVVRVLDAGGDKPVRALHLDPQRNGFLGVRGLRWLLSEPDVLHTQLRAICRAAHGRDVAVMAPMVTVAAEARAFRDAVDAAVASLAADGIEHAAPAAVGVMIEVPAAALAADEIADVVDFVSLGTNDLASYTAAADRTEPGVADLVDPHGTALWRLIEQACRLAAGRADVAVCGELAAVPELAVRLVDLGVTELSMAPAAVPAVKRALRAR